MSYKAQFYEVKVDVFHQMVKEQISKFPDFRRSVKDVIGLLEKEEVIESIDMLGGGVLYRPAAAELSESQEFEDLKPLCGALTEEVIVSISNLMFLFGL